jgi:hypothetical protein
MMRKEIENICTDKMTALCASQIYLKILALGRDAHPARWNVVIFAVVVVSSHAVLIVLARGKPDASPSRDVFTKLAAASHVHLQDNHAKEIAVLTRFPLA